MCEESQSVHSVERCASFVDSIMVPSTAEREEEVKADTPAETGTVVHPMCVSSLISNMLVFLFLF